MARQRVTRRTSTTEESWQAPKPPPVDHFGCIACRFTALPGDKAFLGGVAVAKLFSDPKTSKALVKAFTQRLCKKHETNLRDLKDLKLLHLSEAIVTCYG